MSFKSYHQHVDIQEHHHKVALLEGHDGLGNDTVHGKSLSEHVDPFHLGDKDWHVLEQGFHAFLARTRRILA